MNLAEALNAALPELPAKKARTGFPRLDPRAIWAENIEEGQARHCCACSRHGALYKFPPEQWQLDRIVRWPPLLR